MTTEAPEKITLVREGGSINVYTSHTADYDTLLTTIDQALATEHEYANTRIYDVFEVEVIRRTRITRTVEKVVTVTTDAAVV